MKKRQTRELSSPPDDYFSRNDSAVRIEMYKIQTRRQICYGKVWYIRCSQLFVQPALRVIEPELPYLCRRIIPDI